MKLQDKVVIVTGASSGIGRAITQLFAREGATVIAFARRKERLEELAQESSASGDAGIIVAFEGDVTSAESIGSVVKYAADTYGKLDILVNNAGIMDNMVPAADVTDELWDQIFEVNTKSVMRTTRSALAIMLSQKSGVFVNIASLGGIFGSRAGVAYTASKHAVVGFTKNLAFQYAQEGIRANIICPGAVMTEIATHMTDVNPFGSARASAGMATNPRLGAPEEIAAVALFLASDDSSFVNGAALPVDAGWGAY